MAFCASGLAFGFVISKSEFFMLPVFLSVLALAVGGIFIAATVNLSINAKLFFCGVCPPIG
jgi:hypothetical protein